MWVPYLRTTEVIIPMHVVCVPCSASGQLGTSKVIALVHVMCVPCNVGSLLTNYRIDRPYACGIYALQYSWHIKNYRSDLIMRVI